jgi:hypothetical protein
MRVERYHVSIVSAEAEGYAGWNGTLLDHSLILHGSNMGN